MTKPARRLAVILTLATCAGMVASGCALFGGQTGQESDKSSAGGGQPCRSDIEPTDGAVGDVDAGVDDASPAAVIDALRGPYTAPFLWSERRTETQISIELLDYDAGTARRSVDGQCNHRLEIAVTFSIATADGLLDEHVVATLVATARQAGDLHVTIPLRELTGTYDGGEVQGTNASTAELSIDVHLSAGATSGMVNLGMQTSGDGVGTATHAYVGTWPARR